MSLPLDAARLAVWSNACLGAHVGPDALAEPPATGGLLHRVAAIDAASASTPVSLPLAVAALRSADWLRCWLVLPRPGDPAGLPGPGEVNRLALAAGQAVVVEGLDAGRSLVLVPSALGSSGVLWTALPGGPARPATTSLAEADRRLKEAIREATEVLIDLDVARARADEQDQIDAVRRGAAPFEVPAAVPARARAVLDTALRLDALLDIALATDGAAVGRGDSDLRRSVLDDLRVRVRHGFVSAVNALAEESVRSR